MSISSGAVTRHVKHQRASTAAMSKYILGNSSTYYESVNDNNYVLVTQVLVYRADGINGLMMMGRNVESDNFVPCVDILATLGSVERIVEVHEAGTANRFASENGFVLDHNGNCAVDP